MPDGVKATVRFKRDSGGIAELNTSNGLVGRGTQRAADKTAERVRGLIVGHGLVDTGAMLADVQTLVVAADHDQVRIQVGTPNAVYSLYQREHFFREALEQLTVGDWTP